MNYLCFIELFLEFLFVCFLLRKFSCEHCVKNVKLSDNIIFLIESETSGHGSLAAMYSWIVLNYDLITII